MNSYIQNRKKCKYDSIYLIFHIYFKTIKINAVRSDSLTLSLIPVELNILLIFHPVGNGSFLFFFPLSPAQCVRVKPGSEQGDCATSASHLFNILYLFSAHLMASIWCHKQQKYLIYRNRDRK